MAEEKPLQNAGDFFDFTGATLEALEGLFFGFGYFLRDTLEYEAFSVCF